MAGALPVAVPEKIFGLTLILDFFDRCHSLGSLHPPPAAVASLPTGLLRSNLRVSCTCKQKNTIGHKSGLSYFGPSGETRTPGILLPKQARYQLRYTRLFDCRGFPWQARFLLRFPKFLRCLTADA